MKTSMNRTSIIIAGAVVLLVGSICQAQGRSQRSDRDFAAGPSNRGPRGPMADRDADQGRGGARSHGPRLPILGALDRLDVTDEQQLQIRTILEDNAEGMQATREAMNEAMAALHDATVNEADDAALQAAATQLGIAAGQQATTHVALVKIIKSVLTEEQLSTLAKLKASRNAEEGQRGSSRRMGPERRGPQHGPQRGNFDRPPHRSSRRGR